MRIALALLALSTITCARPPKPLPIEPGHQQLAESSLRNFHAAINAGNCDQALTQHTPRHQREWLQNCHYIRATWGNLHSLEPATWQMQNAEILEAQGRARFEKGEYQFDFLWSVRQGNLQLIHIQFHNNGERISAPQLDDRQFHPPPPSASKHG